LHQMLDTPGGARALAAAARSLLLNNPILQHPGAPCHALLTQLAGLSAAPGTPGLGLNTHTQGQGQGRPSFSSEASRVDAAPRGFVMPPPRPPGQSRFPTTSQNLLVARSGFARSSSAVHAPEARLSPAEALRRDVSSEAVEVLSSNFFSTRAPSQAASSRSGADEDREQAIVWGQPALPRENDFEED